jgi:hypothetical protein
MKARDNRKKAIKRAKNAAAKQPPAPVTPEAAAIIPVTPEPAAVIPPLIPVTPEVIPEAPKAPLPVADPAIEQRPDLTIKI